MRRGEPPQPHGFNSLYRREWCQSTSDDFWGSVSEHLNVDEIYRWRAVSKWAWKATRIDLRRRLRDVELQAQRLVTVLYGIEAREEFSEEGGIQALVRRAR